MLLRGLQRVELHGSRRANQVREAWIRLKPYQRSCSQANDLGLDTRRDRSDTEPSGIFQAGSGIARPRDTTREIVGTHLAGSSALMVWACFVETGPNC